MHSPYVLRAFDGVLGYTYDPKHPSYFGFAVVAFAFNYGAYMTDVVVSSYRAVDKGQLEAAYSVGMSTFQAMWRIVIPQAVVDLSSEPFQLLHVASEGHQPGFRGKCV